LVVACTFVVIPQGSAFVVAFLGVTPKGDLLLFVLFATIFRVFSPKIACQVPNPPNSFQQKEIELAF
jgi:hypothetical protein